MDKKYYIYLSNSKVDMLYNQYASIVSKETESRFTAGIQPVKLDETIRIRKEENSFDKVSILERKMNSSIGTVSSPNDFIRGTVPWSCIVKDTVIWGDFFVSDSVAYIVVLFGSYYNLIGNGRGINDNSQSVMPAFIKTFIDYDQELASRYEKILPRINVLYRDADYPVWEMMENSLYACKYGRRNSASHSYSFLAKVLHKETLTWQYRNEYFSELRKRGNVYRANRILSNKDLCSDILSTNYNILSFRYVLASPLYVTMDSDNPDVEVVDGTPRVRMDLAKLRKKDANCNSVINAVIKKLQNSNLNNEANVLREKADAIASLRRGKNLPMTCELWDLVSEYVIDSN